MRRRRRALDARLRDLETGNSVARLAAVGALGMYPFTRSRSLPSRVQIDQVFMTLRRILRTDPSLEVRFAAAHVLGHWHEWRAARLLIECLCDTDEAPRVRGAAAEGLGGILAQPPRRAREIDARASATDALLEALDSSEPEVRFWVLYASGQLRITEARPRIEAMARADHAICPGLWRVSDEAADVLTFWDCGNWPERVPGSVAASMHDVAVVSR